MSSFTVFVDPDLSRPGTAGVTRTPLTTKNGEDVANEKKKKKKQKARLVVC